jgi:hypothetical protein
MHPRHANEASELRRLVEFWYGVADWTPDTLLETNLPRNFRPPAALPLFFLIFVWEGKKAFAVVAICSAQSFSFQYLPIS